MLVALVVPAQAQMTRIDMVAMGRALSFVDNLRARSAVHIGIVYDPQLARSAQQAAEIQALLHDGLRVGTLRLEPVMVPVDDLKKSRVEALFMTDGLGDEAATVRQVSRARKMPCISFDLAEVRDGNCAMGIRTHPRIDVFVNDSAAAASGLDLAAVFRIMAVGI